LEGKAVQAWAYKFYNSTRWKNCREAYKKIMYYQCEICGGVGEIVHHKEPLTRENINDVDITLSLRNLRLLCRKCHGAEHGENVTATGVCFDDDGNLVSIPPIFGTP
jgi:5-methylcytosine-specific restriction endonuclease McrA